MKRMTFMALAVFLAAALALPVFGAGTAEPTAEKPIELKLGILSAVGGLEDLAVNKMAEVAREKSNGRLIINIFPASQLGNFVSQMESIAIGTQDLLWGDLGWLGNFEKDYQILIMPYAFRTQEHLFQFMDSELGLELEKKLEQRGYVLLTKHAYQLPKCAISRKPLQSAADFRGLKMRVPEWPIYMGAWQAMGTNTVVVSWGELYLALAQGVADAMTAGFEFIYPGKFHEVAPYIVRTHHAFGARGAIVGTKTLDKLPADLKAVLKEAALAGEKEYLDLLMAAKVEHEKLILAAGGKIVDIDTEPLRKLAVSIVPQLEADGHWSKGLFEKIQQLK